MPARSKNFKELPKRRGGCIWTKRPNKVHPGLAKGDVATVTATPQAIRDLKSVAEFVREGVEEPLMAERMRMLSWYLPPSRRLMLMPDDWSAQSMTPLADLCAPR